MLSNKYHKDILKLFSGGFLSQIIGILTIPLITRLYSPELYGEYNIYIQLIVGASVLVSLRYEHLLILSKSYSESVQLLQNIMVLASAVSILLAVLMLILPLDVLGLSPSLFNTYIIVVVVVSGFLTSITYGLEQTLQKNESFFKSSVGELAFKITFFIFCILFSYFQLETFGLIVSYLIAMFVKMTYLLWLTKFKLFVLRFKISLLFFKTINKRAWGLVYSHFLLMCTQLIPLNFISSNYGSNNLGQFALVFSTLNILVVIFSQPMSKVYFQRFVLLKTKSERLNHWNKTFRLSFLLGVPVYCFVYFTSDWGYEFVFGKQWADAGQLAKIILFSSFFAFISRPMESTSIALNIWWYSPLWHSLRVLLVSVLFYILNQKGYSLNESLVYYVTLLVIVYIVDILSQRLLIKKIL